MINQRYFQQDKQKKSAEEEEEEKKVYLNSAFPEYLVDVMKQKKNFFIYR